MLIWPYPFPMGNLWKGNLRRNLISSIRFNQIKHWSVNFELIWLKLIDEIRFSWVLFLGVVFIYIAIIHIFQKHLYSKTILNDCFFWIEKFYLEWFELDWSWYWTKLHLLWKVIYISTWILGFTFKLFILGFFFLAYIDFFRI